MAGMPDLMGRQDSDELWAQMYSKALSGQNMIGMQNHVPVPADMLANLLMHPALHGEVGAGIGTGVGKGVGKSVGKGIGTSADAASTYDSSSSNSSGSSGGTLGSFFKLLGGMVDMFTGGAGGGGISGD